MSAILRNAFVAAAVLAFLLASSAPATMVPRLEMPELAHSAELIVHGRVVHHWSDWDRAHRFIWTHYLLEVTEVLKGLPPVTVTISEPGGSAGGTMMKIAGVTEYADSEEVIVFLQRTPIGYWRCYGWGQGKYTVSQSGDGLKRIRTNLAGLVLVDPPGATGGKRPGTGSPLGRLNGMGLGDFMRLVRREAGR